MITTSAFSTRSLLRRILVTAVLLPAHVAAIRVVAEDVPAWNEVARVASAKLEARAAALGGVSRCPRVREALMAEVDQVRARAAYGPPARVESEDHNPTRALAALLGV